MTEHPADRAQFHAMAQGTQEDWMKIGMAAAQFNTGLADRVLTHLKLLEGDCGGFAVDRMEHSLQSASLAHRDGMDDEYVVCALLHDIGDTLASHNHAELAATILKPFVSDENHWMLQNHGIFQGYYFFHYIGGDRDMREAYRGHPHFKACAEFCEQYDQAAFDPGYDSAPLSFFEPMVRRVFARPINSIYAKAAAEGAR